MPFGVDQALDPRSVTVQRLGATASAAVLSLFLLGAAFFFLLVASAPLDRLLPGVSARALLFGMWGAITLLLLVRAILWPAVQHRHASYRLDEQKIEMRRGVINRSLVSVPRSRVQHTDVAQGPLERWFGLGTLVVFTAGTRFAKVSQHGMPYQTALRIRDHLLPDDGGDAV